MKLINPANKRKYCVIVVGTGSAVEAATMAELGYEELNFCYQDSPRRSQHSSPVCINGENYQSDGGVFSALLRHRQGGDFRSREGNVYRLEGQQSHHRQCAQEFLGEITVVCL